MTLPEAEVPIWVEMTCGYCGQTIGYSRMSTSMLTLRNNHNLVCEFQIQKDDTMRARPELTQAMRKRDLAYKQKQLGECLPLPNFEEVLGEIPLLPQHMVTAPEDIYLIPDDAYTLYVAQFVQNHGIDRLLDTDDYGDLSRLWQTIQMVHIRSHRMLERAAKDVSSSITGSYLMLAIMHEAVKKMLTQLTAKMEEVA